MSSDGSLDTPTSNIHVSTKTLNISIINSSKKELNSIHIGYAYPQGLPLKETQANLHLVANLFNTTKTKDPQPSCDVMPTMPTSNSL